MITDVNNTDSVFTIKDNSSGHWYHCSENQSLLVAMERNGKQLIAVGCRGGGCGRCKIKVLSGDYVTKKMSAKHISASDKQQRVILACRAFPTSDLVFEIIGPLKAGKP